ncbi:MAG: PPC domain-containing protein, partial [Anaerolineae bacterium]|nr:PPC domain-containing protein [Anaerolineae bacterium]
LPESGTYTIVATRFGFASGFSTGEYTLSLRAGDSVTPSPVRGTDWLPNDDLPDDLRLINYNETVVGTIGDSNSDDWYTFQGNQGDVISVTMFPEDVVAGGTWLDPFLILTTASGVELALNDDQGSGVDAAISDFILPTTDTYLIRATRYGFENGPSSGSYTLTITAFTTSPVTTSVIALDYGDTASGNLSFDSPIDRYTFEGHAGEQVTIRIAGGQDLQPVLVLRKPDGNTLGSDINPAGAPEAVLLRVPLPADGTYTVEVIPKDLNTGGDYVLLLLGHDIPAINPGAFEPAPGVDLEVVLIWSSGADLDLLYSAPENAADPHRNAANDLCQNMTPTPVERLAWDTGSAEPGSYAITVAYRSNCNAQQDPVAFILAIARNGDVIDLIGGTLAREGDLYTTRATYDR